MNNDKKAISTNARQTSRLSMHTALMVGCLALCGVSNAAILPGLQSCVGTTYDISTKVENASSCMMLTPLDGKQNDSVDMSYLTYTVNTIIAGGFFGISDWRFDGKYEGGTDKSSLVDFQGSGTGGTYKFVGGTGYTDLMFVFKDGEGTNLVGYRLIPTIGLDGKYSTPFTTPPFDFNGNSTAHDISHISVYYRREGGGDQNDVPEPGTAAILGLGLLGMGLMLRGRKKQS
jgi:hypothetical protein